MREAITRARAIPGLGVLRASTMEEALGESIRWRTFNAWVFGGFAVAALGVTGIGIFGLTAMSTARRVREMGLRVALGASRGAVVSGILREQLAGVLGGLAGGGLVAWWAVQFLKRYLYQFTGQDPRIWGIATTTVVLAVLAGVLVPALRAARVDPMIALRTE